MVQYIYLYIYFCSHGIKKNNVLAFKIDFNYLLCIMSDEEDGFNKPIDKPRTVGENTAGALSDAWNFSFSNINKEFKNWRYGAE